VVKFWFDVNDVMIWCELLLLAIYKIMVNLWNFKRSVPAPEKKEFNIKLIKLMIIYDSDFKITTFTLPDIYKSATQFTWQKKEKKIKNMILHL
jgi:hypothetical protein